MNGFLFCFLVLVGTAALAGEPIDIFVAGAEDIEGVADAAKQYPQYREQNIVITNRGTVVVVCQGRNQSAWSDRSGQDLVCKRSADSGKTWSKGRLMVTHGKKSICPNAAVYDRETGRIHVLYSRFEWPYTNADSRKTWEGQKRRQFDLWSDDEGKTWSKPREITAMMREKDAIVVFGSGEGIQLRHGPRKGRLLVPGGDFEGGKEYYAFLSDDHGKTWFCGKPVPCGASETAVAELPDGTLLANNRGRRGFRRRAVSADQGQTWAELREDKGLRSVSCNGSLIAVTHPEGKDGSVLLCSVPVGPKRTHGTVYASFDGGKTWPVQKLAVEGSFAYSSLMELPDGSIGLFYECEGYTRVRLVKLGKAWLAGK
ncbi:exo-alpha-sialidase [bacterium]|nr:exo-alpha-sialidase [bacterium]